jgi:SAM-dependent methyltransferase
MINPVGYGDTRHSCPICGSAPSAIADQLIHHQRFVIPNRSEVVAYDVVRCLKCGFMYAANIPSQCSLSEYYSSAEHHLHPSIPTGLAEIHKDFHSFIAQNISLNTDTEILDVGSGMGHFLSLFKKAGNDRLLGLEPSKAAAGLADVRYGIEIEITPIERFRRSKRFDLVTACGVLEHIADLSCFTTALAKLVKRNGTLFVAVPDAGAFDGSNSREPFLEFAIEHINFFTRRSLSRLMSKVGFSPLIIESRHNRFYDNNYLCALFRKTDCATTTAADDFAEDITPMHRYLHESKVSLHRISTKIAQLRDVDTPLIIWGAGSLTRRLCATTALSETPLIAFIDKNPQLCGQSLMGKPIHPPGWLHGTNRQATVLIGSTSYADAIEQELVDSHAWLGQIIRLDRLIA